MGGLFGGGDSGKSENKAYGWIKDNYGDTGSGAFNQGTGMLGSILSGNSAQGNAALDRLWDSSGGNFLLNQGVDNITSKMAKLGLTRSGSYGKALEDYRSGLASTRLFDILGQYSNLAQLGLGAGNLVANAGQVSKGGSSGGGLGSLIGAALAFI